MLLSSKGLQMNSISNQMKMLTSCFDHPSDNDDDVYDEKTLVNVCTFSECDGFFLTPYHLVMALYVNVF